LPTSTQNDKGAFAAPLPSAPLRPAYGDSLSALESLPMLDEASLVSATLAISPSVGGVAASCFASRASSINAA
jgi:hypothetical protein